MNKIKKQMMVVMMIIDDDDASKGAKQFTKTLAIEI